MLMEPRRVFVAAALTALAVGGIGLAAQSAPPRRLLPVDEAASRPDFFTFRAQLQASLARHDLAALMAVVHPKIKNGFGGDDGEANFESKWRPGDADSQVWEELAAVLALGGTFESADTFVAPYVFSRWPQGIDSFEHVAVVGDRVRIRTAPRVDAESAGVSSFGILAVARQFGDTSEEWTAVRLSPTKVGYIASRFVRSPIGYRVYFSKQEGRWQMLMFLAGD
jgi:hypothetical protein